MPTAQQQKKRSLSVFVLSVMTIVILYGIENAAVMAQFGWGLITVYALAAILILLPVGLVSAELASAFPQDGGLYLWIREAFGPRVAFFALFQQWIAWVFTVPVVFTFVAVTATYAFNPGLQENSAYAAVAVIAITVVATSLNFFGVRKSGMVSVISLIFLALIPTVIILVLAASSIASGYVQPPDFSARDLWIFDHPESFGWMIAGVNAFVGIEISAYFLKQLRNPQRQYPIVLVVSGTLTFVFLTLLTLAVFILSPTDSVSLTAGIMETIAALFNSHNLPYLIPIIAAMIAFGGLLKSSTIVLGPAVGLLTSARYGHLPARLTTVNKNGAPVAILVFQAIIILVASLAFIVFKNVQTTFFLLLVVSVIPYMLAYILMFAAAIKLRYTRPDVKRDFRVPGGKIGIWVVGVIGSVASIAVFIEGFVPTAVIPADQRTTATVLVGAVTIIVCIIPFVIDRHKSSDEAPEGETGVEVRPERSRD